MSYGRGHGLPSCLLANAFEAATHAYRHLANGTESENGTERRSGEWAQHFSNASCFFIDVKTGRVPANPHGTLPKMN